MRDPGEHWDKIATDDHTAVIKRPCTMEEYHAITQEQRAYLKPLIEKQLDGTEQTALDYGCGPGRLTPMLRDIFPSVMGYDPSPVMINLAERLAGISYQSGDPGDFFALSQKHKTLYSAIFIFCVLGDLEAAELWKLARDIDSILSHHGLLILCDIMVPTRRDMSWQVRPMQSYTDLFSDYLTLNRIGELSQGEHQVTVLAGRKA